MEFLVVPDWPCMTWYVRLHEKITAEAIKLPNEEDLFIDKKNFPLGVFAWDSWLFYRPMATHSCSDNVSHANLEVQLNPGVPIEKFNTTKVGDENPTTVAEIKGRNVIVGDLSK